MGMKASRTFRSYAAVATTENANHPASNVALVTDPRRTWEGSGSLTLTLDGGAQGIDAVFINNCNFATATVIVGAVTFSSIAIPRDTRVGRRKAWIDNPGGSGSSVRIVPGALDAGETAARVGAVALLGSVVELADGPGVPYRWTPHQAKTDTRFPGGRREVNVEGPRHLELVLADDVWLTSLGIRDQLLDVFIAAEYGPVVLWENLGHVEAAYLVRQMDDVSFAIGTADASFAAEVGLEECI